MNVHERTDWPESNIFIGVGKRNGGGVFVRIGAQLIRLKDESPAYRAAMETIGGARKARREAGKAVSL